MNRCLNFQDVTPREERERREAFTYKWLDAHASFYEGEREELTNGKTARSGGSERQNSNLRTTRSGHDQTNNGFGTFGEKTITARTRRTSGTSAIQQSIIQSIILSIPLFINLSVHLSVFP